MSNGGPPYPRFRFWADHNKALEKQKCFSWSFHAVTHLQLLSTNSRRKPSLSLPFRLDTEAFVSIIPEEWVIGPYQLGPFLKTLSKDHIPFQTAAGDGNGRMAPNVLVSFTDAPAHTFLCDFLISPNLNKRGYGLFSIRDILRHFSIRTEGTYFPDKYDDPFRFPELVLHPWNVAEGVRYRCSCPHEVQGKKGLKMRCEDCNQEFNQI